MGQSASTSLPGKENVPSKADIQNRLNMEEIKEMINSDCVVVFSQTRCSYCIKLKDALNNLNIRFSEINLGRYETSVAQSLLNYTNNKTVPQLFINNKYIGGYSEFQKINFDNKLMQMIEECGKKYTNKPNNRFY